MQVIVRELGEIHYNLSFEAMKNFAYNRDEKTCDEIWLLEHFPVFTQGRNGKQEHLLNTTNIEVIQSDRGGKITYHGLGQIVMYVLVDIKRQKSFSQNFTVRTLVTALETSVINTLQEYNITAFAQKDAPGVYVASGENIQKICSLGLKIQKGSSIHGLALNVDMDLSPFSQINPCGYEGLEMTQVANLIDYQPALKETIKEQLVYHFCHLLGYDEIIRE